MKKFGVMLLAALLCMLSLSGCGDKVTAKGIMYKVQENTKDAKSMSANVVMNMKMNYDMAQMTGSEEDSVVSATIVLDMDMDLLVDPLSMYMDMVMSYEAEGETQDMAYEMYGVPGENENEFVLYTGADEEWYTETTDLSEYSDMEEQINLAVNLTDDDDVEYELAEETEKIGDKEVYVLNGSIKGETLQELMSSMENLESVLGTEIDLSNAEATLKYAVYKDTFMPAAMELDLSSFVSGLLNDTGITFDELTMVYTFKSFDTVTEITVPEEVKAAVAADEEPAEDVLISTTDTTMDMTAAAVDAPAAIGEWVSTYTMLEDGTYFQIGVRVTDVERGEAAQKMADELNALYEIEEDLNENLEYCLVEYEVYVPTDYPDAAFNGVEMYVTDTDGTYFETDYEYDDMYWVQVVDDTELYAEPGNTAKGIGIYTMEKNRSEYLFEIGDSWFNESYVAIQE